MTKDEIPVSRKSKEDAKKRREPSRAVESASKEVKKRVESEKPGPETERVDTVPDSGQER